MTTRKVKGHDPIGVFDSGVGGLSVLLELKKLMPKERFIFLADQAFVPYGEKATKQLQGRAGKIMRFFVNNGAKLVVVACNTATCYAIKYLRTNFSVPIVGTEPAIKPAAKVTKSGIIGLIATPATAKSKTVTELIKRFAGNIKVLRVGCAGLEDAVEKGGWQSRQIKPLLERYLASIKNSGADQIVLGCTHYPFLKSQIRGYLGKNVSLVDGNLAIAKQARRILNTGGIRLRANAVGTVKYLTTGNPAKFQRVATMLMKKPIRASQIKLS
ncbi:MAG: glutamate racemase [Patescibacteria group bacterium]